MVPPETAHQESAIPIARRLARKAEFFPLAWHGARTETRMPMVGWYDPVQFCSTGLKSLVSLFVGEQSDRRIVQALAARRQEYYDHTIHYRDGARGPQPATDSGARRTLDRLRLRHRRRLESDLCRGVRRRPDVAEVAGPEGPVDLPRGDVLIFGGDEVYPTASREEYQRRLVSPVHRGIRRRRPGRTSARLRRPRQPRLVRRAVGLHAAVLLRHRRPTLRRLVDTPAAQLLRAQAAARLVAGRQRRPAAERLRRAADGALPRDCRPAHAAGRQSDPLPVAAGLGAKREKYRNMDRVFDETDLIFLREEVFAKAGIDVKVYLAGDLHHYRRHEETAESAGDAQTRCRRSRRRRRRFSAAHARGGFFVAAGGGSDR